MLQKNYPQTGRIIQPQFVEIKPAKTCRKQRESCYILQFNYWQKTDRIRETGRNVRK